MILNVFPVLSSNLFPFMDKTLLLQSLIKIHLKRTFLESGCLKVSILKAFTSSLKTLN